MLQVGNNLIHVQILGLDLNTGDILKADSIIHVTCRDQYGLYMRKETRMRH